MRDIIENNLGRLFKAGNKADTRRRWGCPPDDEIAAFADRGVMDRERERIEAHLEKCAFCREEVAFLAWMNEAETPEAVPAAWLARARELSGSGGRHWAGWSWRWGSVAVAAACMLLIGVVAFRKPQREFAPTGTQNSAPTVRGVTNFSSVPELLLPTSGAAVSVQGLEFQWKPVKDAQGYQISVVTSRGDLLWEQKTEGTTAKLPVGVNLAPGQRYFVWIRAFVQDGKVVQSRSVTFTAASSH